MKAILSKCYDDWGNLKDNALNIAFNLGKKEGLRIGRKQGREDAVEEIKEHFMKVFDEEQNRIRASWSNADIRETIWFDLEQMQKGAENE